MGGDNGQGFIVGSSIFDRLFDAEPFALLVQIMADAYRPERRVTGFKARLDLLSQMTMAKAARAFGSSPPVVVSASGDLPDRTYPAHGIRLPVGFYECGLHRSSLATYAATFFRIRLPL